ncbi:hypothetical protein BSLG_007338 [Batrachochytrium salamandrivorans]|nr:hypothetical protein BSLG_007338 [Batrachochytrium salamandrivorans]
MSAMLPAAAAAPPSQSIANGPTLLVKINRKFQKLLDDLTPYTPQRWAGTAILGVLFLIRAFTAGGWYIVTYTLGIYLLNLLLAFLTPKFDPAAEDEFDNDDEGPSLPTRQDDEFRPFIRRLPEFNITMRRQIMHMIKYKYVPWDFNKKQYNSGTVKSEK